MAVTHASNAVHPTPQKSECVETLTTPTFERALASQNEFHAFASMVLAGLPFPPLPVMVRQGADGEYAIASSFDLLQQAIVAQQVALQGGTNATSTAKSATEVVEAKTAMLMRLQRDMAAHVQNARETTSDAFLERAYDIYCCAFRAYLLDNYPVCTRDLRFYPLQDVPKTHTLMDHARSHLKGSFIMSAAGYADAVSPFDGPVPPSYADVICFYAQDLGSLPVEATNSDLYSRPP